MKGIVLLQLLLAIALVLEPFVDAKGFVLDSEGAAIAKAKITYHRDLSGELMAGVTEDHGISDGTSTTQKDGGYSALVHPGIYDVCVIADSFTPSCRKTVVTEKSHSFPTFRLHADPLITKKIGDLFPSK